MVHIPLGLFMWFLICQTLVVALVVAWVTGWLIGQNASRQRGG